MYYYMPSKRPQTPQFLDNLYGGSKTGKQAIHDITVSNSVRSAAVNKLLGVEFNVIKVVCILVFHTISINSKA